MSYLPPAPEKLSQLLGPDIPAREWAPISLQDTASYDLMTHAGLSQCIRDQLSSRSASIGVGGYLERRNIYRRSGHFTEGEEARNIHLGCDIWTPVGQEVFSPLDGQVQSKAYNAAPFDYGATLIVRHVWDHDYCYALYGHIQISDIENWSVGDWVQSGELLCQVGDLHENGGWVPHLHFQLIRDLEGKKGDYPGVAASSQLEFYRNNCPDPNQWLV